MINSKFDPLAEKSNRSQWKTLKILAIYLWPTGRGDLKRRVIAALLCLAMAKVVNVYVPFLYKMAVDRLTVTDMAISLPLGIIIAYGGARFLTQFFGELRDLIFVRVSQHAQRTIALNTFKHLHELSLRFHLDRQTGGLSRVIERGTQGVQFVLGFILFNILPTLLEIIMVTAVLLYQFNILFAAATFLTIAGYIAFTLLVTEWRLKFRRKMNEKDTEANTKSIDSLLNYETVKYFGNEEHEYKRFDGSLAGYEDAAVKSQTSLSLLNMGQGLIIGLGLIAVMTMAAGGVIDGTMTVGDFVLVNTFLIQLYLPLNFLGFVYRQIKQSLVDMDKMFELREIDTEIKDSHQAGNLVRGNGEVEFRRVSFAYNADRPILKNVSFKVSSGKTVAIVGPSGAGKSTISRLLFRFYDVSSGAIAIDGQNIREISQHSLRRAIGIVPQDTVLFNDTIAYNIQYGCPDCSRKKLIEGARLASIDDFINTLPDGYNTLVGERGLKLSGGEKQRVAIARTILKNPEILVFDEATSALDSSTEKEIQASLKEVSRDRTTIVIAHRLSTIVDADEILVLINGEIAERGRHSELLKAKGEYALMWARQQEAQEYRSKLDMMHEK
ncbi:MAG: ABC transporter ATP-binding protein/permease [Deltaproteobacteria bacterium]|nr:ABC transporter ATP-binding protein/permease [Deltaproteobacteria bacterium]